MQPRLDDYMGSVFETACRQFVALGADVGFGTQRVGAWWNTTSTDEVDVVAVGEDGLLVGACKWGRVTAEDLATLRRRSPMVAADLGANRRVYHALFAGQAVTDPRVLDEASQGNVLLFNADALFTALAP